MWPRGLLFTPPVCDHSRRFVTYGNHYTFSVFQITVIACYAGLGGWLLRRTNAHVGAVLLGVLGITLLLHATLLVSLLHHDFGGRMSVGLTLSFIGLAVAIAAAAGALRAQAWSLAGMLFLTAAAFASATQLGSSDTEGSAFGWPLLAHIGLSIIAYALLTVAALTAVLLAFKERALRRRTAATSMRNVISVETLETQLFGAIGAGFVALSLAIFSGLFYVENMFAQHLVHKTVLTLSSWVLFAVLLFGRWRFGWRAQTAVRWTLGGFFVLLLAYFGSRFVLEVLLGRQWG